MTATGYACSKVAWHPPDPDDKVAVQRVPDTESENVTVPVGVPEPDEGVTLATNVTVDPIGPASGVALTVVVVAVCATVSVVDADDAPNCDEPL